MSDQKPRSEAMRAAQAIAQAQQVGAIIDVARAAAIIDREWEQQRAEDDLPEIPCCPVHEAMLRERRLPIPLDNCVVCIRNQRDELQAQIAELREALAGLMRTDGIYDIDRRLLSVEQARVVLARTAPEEGK